jgi:hypothetical protein
VSAARAQSASATTTPFARIGADELFVGDCREVVPLVVQPESIDAIVTDPPYDLKTGSGRGFMGKAWDGTGVAFDVRTWEVAFDALKPGGHLVAFGGTRTAHRMTCAIEDAGFEIRDTLAWLYGSGFPKSLDVSKAIDRVVPRLEMFRPFAAHYAERRRAEGLTHSQICAAGEFFGEHNHGGASVNWERGHNVPTPAQWAVLQPLLGLSDEWASLIERVEAEREHLGTSVGTARPGIPTLGGRTTRREFAITGAATDAARQWEGWGTALKPCHEPIILARKPLSGTVAANVLEHGTGALNIDGCRVGVGDEVTARPPLSTREHEGYRRPWNDDLAARAACEKRRDAAHDRRQQLGRWPGNVVLGCACEEEHEPGCAVRLLDEQSGTRPPARRDDRPGDGVRLQRRGRRDWSALRRHRWCLPLLLCREGQPLRAHARRVRQQPASDRQAAGADPLALPPHHARGRQGAGPVRGQRHHVARLHGRGFLLHRRGAASGARRDHLRPRA